jgi:hypothetical protein
LGSALGVLIATAIFGGLFFAQCVYPFIRGTPSEIWTCEDDEVRAFCDDPITIGGFTAAICGRDDVQFTGRLVRPLIIGDGPVHEEPGTLDLEIECPGLELKWSIDEERLDEFESLDDLEPRNDQTRLAVDLLAEYTLGFIDMGEARQQLLGSSGGATASLSGSPSPTSSAVSLPTRTPSSIRSPAATPIPSVAESQTSLTQVEAEAAALDDLCDQYGLLPGIASRVRARPGAYTGWDVAIEAGSYHMEFSGMESLVEPGRLVLHPENNDAWLFRATLYGVVPNGVCAIPEPSTEFDRMLAKNKLQVARLGFVPSQVAWTGDGLGGYLVAIEGLCTPVGDGYCQQAFFFSNDQYLGTDTYSPSIAIHRVADAGEATIAVTYAHYATTDPFCCPSLPDVTITYHWDGERLVPSGTPPDHGG